MELVGGGESNYSGSYKGNAGSSEGGAGGDGSTHNRGTSIPTNGGWSGNPSGKSASGAITAANGTGGLLIVYSNNVENNGKINSQGSNGSYTSKETHYFAHGGASGGGSINIFYKGQYTGSGSSDVSGGWTRVYGKDGSVWLRKGGDGTVTTGSISTGTFVKDE